MNEDHIHMSWLHTGRWCHTIAARMSICKDASLLLSYRAIHLLCKEQPLMVCAYKPSPIRTIPSASESHRICRLVSIKLMKDSRAYFAASAGKAYRRSGIAPCPEGLYASLCHKA